MKILIIRTSDAPTDSRTLKECFALLKAGHEVSVLDWDRKAKHGLERSQIERANYNGVINRISFGIPSTVGAGIRKNLAPYLKFFRACKSYIKRHHREYDAFHLCDFQTMFMLFKYLKRKRHIVVYDIFDYYPDIRQWPSFLRKRLVKRDNYFINNADAVIICSDNRIKQLGDVSPKRLEIIHNAPSIFVENTSADSFTKIEPKRTKIVYLGLLCNGRFIPELIKTVESDPALELHLGGFGELEKYVELKSKENSRIIYHGLLPYDDVLKIENTCDIFVALYDPSVPNNRYSAPNKFYEALALGKPIIVAKGMGFDDFFDDYHFGIAVSPDESGIRIGVDYLLANQGQWANWQQEEQSLFASQYSWNIMESRLALLYDQLAGPKQE